MEDKKGLAIKNLLTLATCSATGVPPTKEATAFLRPITAR